ncbi:TPA: transposase [Bacillus cereus]
MIDTNVKTTIGEQMFHQKIQSELPNYTEGKENKNNHIPDSYLLVYDVWDLDVITKIENVMKYEQKKLKSKSLTFLAHNFSMNLELKYVFYKKLFNQGWSLTNIFGGQKVLLKKLANFLNETYPKMDSLLNLDLDLEKAEKRWIWWLNENNIKTIKKINRTALNLTNQSPNIT